jgi:hypothetical protein
MPALRQRFANRRADLILPQNEGNLASANIDRFMVIPRPTARITEAAKLEFSSNNRSKKPEAGHLYVDSLVHCHPQEPRRTAQGQCGSQLSHHLGLAPITLAGLLAHCETY